MPNYPIHIPEPKLSFPTTEGPDAPEAEEQLQKFALEDINVALEMFANFLLLWMDMDKSWMNARARYLPVYRQGVQNFIDFARHKADGLGRIKCPCKRCVNIVYRDISLVEEHLLSFGMDKKYTRWIWHGEGDPYAPLGQEGNPNVVVRNDDHGDADEPIEHPGVRSLLHDFHQGVRSDIPITTPAPEGSSDQEHNIDGMEGTSEQFAKLVRDA